MTNPVDRFLSDAISAARDEADDGVSDGAHTRLRVRESLANTGASRRKRFTLIAAVIASLFGSTAFAYWAGWRPPWSKPAVVADAPEPESGEKVSMRLPERTRGGSAIASEQPAVPDAGVVEEVAPAPTPAPAVVEEVAPSPTPAPAIVEKTAPRVETPAPTHTTKSRVRGTPAPVPTPAPVEVAPTPTPAPVEVPPAPQVTKEAPRPEVAKAQPNAELAAYRNAHQLHFRGSDPKAALVAWDAYLKAYPNGALALEARYDRALVLVKMARWADARTALAPFANAKVGSYRQREAAEILAAIRDR